MLQDGTTPLHSAARLGQTATAEMLLKAGADVKATNKVRPKPVGCNYFDGVFTCIVRDVPVHKRVNSL